MPTSMKKMGQTKCKSKSKPKVDKLLSYDAGNEAGTGLGPGSQSASIGRIRQGHNVVSTLPRKGGAVGETPFDRFVSKSHPATSPKVAVAPMLDQSNRLR